MDQNRNFQDGYQLQLLADGEYYDGQHQALSDEVAYVQRQLRMSLDADFFLHHFGQSTLEVLDDKLCHLSQKFDMGGYELSIHTILSENINQLTDQIYNLLDSVALPATHHRHDGAIS